MKTVPMKKKKLLKKLPLKKTLKWKLNLPLMMMKKKKK
jgi:hypothetical protein